MVGAVIIHRDPESLVKISSALLPYEINPGGHEVFKSKQGLRDSAVHKSRVDIMACIIAAFTMHKS